MQKMKEIEYWKSTQLESYPNEEWKSLDFMGYPNYEISSLGRVKSLYKDKILRQVVDMHGYLYVCLYRNKTHKNIKVHRLVLESFIDNPNNLPCIDHISTNKKDCRLQNLAFCSHKTNSNNPLTLKHMSEWQKGENSPMWGKMGKDAVRSIPLVQLSLKGSYIRTWDCAADIERELRIGRTHISQVCKGKRHTAGGYRWMYLSEYKGA